VTTFTPGTFSYKGTNNLTIGGNRSVSATKNFDLDDFRFYGTALTPAQVKAEMMQENPTTSPFDLGSSGPSTVPTIMGSTAPAPGTATFAVDMENLEASNPGVLMVGLGATKAFGAIPLPFNIDFLLAGTGNNLHVDPFFFLPFASSATGTASIGLPIPAVAVEGVHLYAQGLLVGTTGAMTPGLDINIEK